MTLSQELKELAITDEMVKAYVEHTEGCCNWEEAVNSLHLLHEELAKVGLCIAPIAALELSERMEKVETFQIGDAVQIIPEAAGMDWQGELPHYITGIDWHPKHGITYTTSDVWPPRHQGHFVEGLTDEWRAEHLRRTSTSGYQQEEA